VKRLEAFSMMTTKKTLRLLSIALVIIISFTFFIQQGKAFAATGSGFPHVQGAQLIDGNGQPLILRGAMIESPFAYIKGWQSKKDPLTNLNTTTFTAMAQQWHMNALRMTISFWTSNLDHATYMA